jgi:hypothetical protein
VCSMTDRLSMYECTAFRRKDDAKTTSKGTNEIAFLTSEQLTILLIDMSSQFKPLICLDQTEEQRLSYNCRYRLDYN